jgi:hypothetical protein|tara:strand:+ start:7199 stop:7555 length:357 start_codon:yes stop_codon:yes gene_type:complete
MNLNLGRFDREIKIYKPTSGGRGAFNEERNEFTLHLTCFAFRRDIEWSTIGEEVHGKQLVVEARTEFYIKGWRDTFSERAIVLYNGNYYEITRIDEMERRRYTRILCLRRDNWTPTIV